METWDQYLPQSGSKLASPSLPDPGLALDGSIEANALGANTLNGIINSILNIGGALSGGIGIALDGTNRRIIVYNATTPAVTIDQNGIYAGATTFAAAPFSVSLAGALVASSATISGSITATSGSIGGWTITATSLKSGSGANTVGLDSGGTNPAIYAGSATPASAPFRVTQAGAMTATNGTFSGTITASTISGNTITGGTISGSTISGNTITGGTISGSTISGNTITGGTISGSTVSGITITGSTITGGTIQTAASGQRILLNSSGVTGYDSGGIKRVSLDGQQLQFFDSSGNLQATLLAGDPDFVGATVSLIGVSGFLYFNQDIVSNGSIKPEVDNAVDLGANAQRWKLIRGVTITPGDLAWEEKECHVCGIRFEPGDRLEMIVKFIDPEIDATRTVPIHRGC